MIPLARIRKLSPERRKQFFEKHGERKVLIRSGQWGAWWRPNSSGYATDSSDAGIYTLNEAFEASGHCGPEKQIFYKFFKPLPVFAALVAGEGLPQQKPPSDTAEAIVSDLAAWSNKYPLGGDYENIAASQFNDIENRAKAYAAAQPGESPKPKNHADFLNYCRSARSEFAKLAHANGWWYEQPAPRRVMIEDLLICFDQMFARLEAQ